MPVFGASTTYDGLSIKPPVTLRMEIKKENLQIVGGYIGKTVTVGGTQYTVGSAYYTLTIYVCKEGEPDCTTSYL